MMNLSLGDVMFVSIENYICKNFVCRMCVRWWVYVSETRFCFSCEVLPVCFVVVSVGLTLVILFHDSDGFQSSILSVITYINEGGSKLSNDT